jgi:CRP-like cAMP-binding protein
MSKKEQDDIVQGVKRRLSVEMAKETMEKHHESQKLLDNMVNEKRRSSVLRTERRLLKRQQTAQIRAASRSSVLRNIELFRDLTGDQLTVFIKRTKMEIYQKDDVICNVGDESDRLWILTSGQVEIVVGESGALDGSDETAKAAGISSAEPAFLTSSETTTAVATEKEDATEESAESADAKASADQPSTHSASRSRSSLLRRALERSKKTKKKIVLNPVCVFGETALFDDVGTDQRMTRTSKCVAASDVVEILSLSRIHFFDICSLMDEKGDSVLKNVREKALATYEDWGNE